MARTKIDKALLDLSGVLPLTGGTLNGSLTFTTTSTQGIVGTVTNDSAAAGNVGETVIASTTSGSAAADNVWSDQVSVSLTAGDWLLSSVATMSNGSNVGTEWQMGISTHSGTSGSGLTYGDNKIGRTAAFPLTGNELDSLTLPSWRLSLSGSTTAYLKTLFRYSSGAGLTLYARLIAVRIR